MASPRIQQRGGAQIGWFSASWPFASISIEPGSLTIGALGSYKLKPSEVQAIEPTGSIPVLTTGIRIHHTRADYPEKIVFYSMGGRDSLLKAAIAAGFVVGEPAIRPARGFPVRLSAIVAFAIIWNVLLFLDRRGNDPLGSAGSGGYSMLALLLALVVATATPYSSRLQSFILRDGHEVGEIRGFLGLLQMVSAFLLFTMAVSSWLR